MLIELEDRITDKSASPIAVLLPLEAICTLVGLPDRSTVESQVDSVVV
ncbi:MAG: hypothetical protein ACKN82_16885 [Pirellula sp.]